MDEMVKRMADIIEEWRQDGGSSLGAARSCLEALREPTDSMIERAMAPYVHGIDDKMRQAFRETIRGYWQAMIDEAVTC